MFKKFVLGAILAGFSLFLISCSSSGGAGQTDTPTEPPPVSTPTTETSGIKLTADGSGDYPDLATAITAAEAGETILLEAGTYRLDETLEINKSISLIGSGMDETIILSSAAKAVLLFSGEGAFALEGITVQHEGDAPAQVVLVENGEIDFSNCRFTGSSGAFDNPNAGLMIRGNTTGTVEKCQVDNNVTAGIFLAGESNVVLDGNTCENNRGVGITFRENAGGEARNNNCTGNDFAGFFLESSGKLLLEENQCSRNGTEGKFGGGIFVSGAAAPTLEGNTCNANSYTGIAYGGGAPVGLAINNECSWNGQFGIYLEGEAAPTLEKNTCNQNGTGDKGAGIAYFDNTSGAAKENTVKENKSEGIFVGEEAAPDLIENVCSMNVNHGINYLGTKGGTAEKNQCGYNGQAGILVDMNSMPLLKENSCFNNRAGIYIVASANPELVDNELNGNSVDNLIDLRP